MRDEVIRVPEPGKIAWVVLFGFGVILPLGILGVILMTADLSKIGGDLYVGAGLMLLVMGWITFTCLRYRDATLREDHLVLRATMFRKKVPYTSIRPSTLRVADTREHPEYRPWLKTGGVGLPGLLAGHFRLQGWKKAFVLVTAHKVVVFQLTDDSWVVFSAESPQRVLESLRERLPGAAAEAAA